MIYLRLINYWHRLNFSNNYLLKFTFRAWSLGGCKSDLHPYGLLKPGELGSYSFRATIGFSHLILVIY